MVMFGWSRWRQFRDDSLSRLGTWYLVDVLACRQEGARHVAVIAVCQDCWAEIGPTMGLSRTQEDIDRLFSGPMMY